ncbi:MAG: hypothetical protein P0Y53_10760 [Candidatus Pseudobacter hemicellulosilyticus]|uniref:Uncharacterized protein n=1 Tax=Candidatus Pseudobacter hemicellulosilyticus TaxID=3121375 RepID=A0AAJ5X0R9_9BACT|nr:MAG: hypothetical protein P0Y53_10760 [Pseudobacter sp.]
MQYKTHWFLWGLAAIIWIYIIYRAFSFPITQDEAYSYFLVKTSYWRAMPGSANTHWANTLCMRLLLWLPGPDALWKIRGLPVLCWPLFVVSVFQISGSLRSYAIKGVFLAATLLNPFLIFYFSLARGYAPGFAVQALSIWLLIRVCRQPNQSLQKWLPFFFAAALSVACNFSFFYCFLLFTLLYVLHLLYNGQYRSLLQKAALPWWSLTGSTLLLTTGMLFFIRQRGDLFYGGLDDPIRSILGSLIRYSTYLPYPSIWPVAGAFGLLALLLLASGYHAAAYLQQRRLSPPLLLTVSAVGVLLLCWLLHTLFGTPYLLDRTAFILYLPVVIGLLMTWDERVGRLPAAGWKKGHAGIAILLGMILLANAITAYNPNNFSEWPYQRDTEACLELLQKSDAKKVGMTMWHHGVFHNFYQVEQPGKYHFDYTLLNKDSDLSTFDYLLITRKQENMPAIGKEWKIVAEHTGSGAVVLRRQP